ncbi:ABC transporter ATP-binding protein [Brevibacillus invocatus]|uniref:ABC transporter ATP-binding protein n=1 Tax=Brevibacillus invocatus TaxID=173959 RepID=A0A3M8BX23_9BACL|nr:ABC transporter ATP-binding protein [Brevibacillus invocatus]RNB68012.1 ABC transporter ATP-binding protein [Brevibacillus invocatus]
MKPLLEVDNLCISFGNQATMRHVVENVSFHVHAGESLGIVGESGCGKSITSLAIMRLLGGNSRVSGQIRLNNKELLSLSENQMRTIRGKDTAMIFQDPMTSLNPLLTIGKQIGEVMEQHDNLPRDEVKKCVLELLTRVGIPRADEIYHEYPHRLSGGMRQRVMIAMAIACQPLLLLADEPTTALDVTIQAQILDLLQKIRKENRMALIMITHDLGVVAEVCDRVMVMYAGQVMETADVRTLLRTPMHPYTKALMMSRPQSAKENRRLNTIPGSVPSPEHFPNGCRFAPRCDQVMPICYEKTPALAPAGEGSACRCWLYDENKESKEVLV